MNVRHRVFRWALVGIWCALIGSPLTFASTLEAQSSPTLEIVAPANGATVDRPVTIGIAHSGIRFDGVRLGGDPEEGTGHWHTYIDGKFAGLSTSNVIEIPNDAYPTIPAGRHTITVALHQNNHAPLNPPVAQTIDLTFSQEVTLVTPQGGQPNLTLVYPTQGATIDAPFVVRIEHTGIRFDGLNSGKDPEPGTGHWHINIDGRYAGMAVSNVLALPNDAFPTIAPGEHTLTAYIHQNNHVATNPPVAQSVRINVTQEIVAGAPPEQPDEATTAAATATTAAATATRAAATATRPAATATRPATTATRPAATATRPAATATRPAATATRPAATATRPAATATTARTTTVAATATRPAATATVARTATTGATNAAGAGTSGGTPTPLMSATSVVALPGIPNTGQAAANVTLPSIVALVCLMLGTLFLYWSRTNAFGGTLATSTRGRSITLDLSGLIRQPLLRTLQATDIWPARPLGRFLQSIQARRIAIRIHLTTPWVLTTRTALAFAAGAFFGLGGSAGLLVVRAGLTPSAPVVVVRSGPVVSAPLPMAAPFERPTSVLAPVQAPVIAQAPAQPTVAVAGAAVPVSAPVQVSRPAPGMVASLPWPDYLPEGMTFAAEDSWPFRQLAAGQTHVPFLVFRDDARWMVIRYVDSARVEIPQSATSKTIDIGGTPATLVHNADDSFTVTWAQGPRTLQMSGAGLSEDELSRTTSSLQAMQMSDLQGKLAYEAAHRQFNITLLWPDYLPPGLNLVPGESEVSIDQPGAIPSTDGYRLTFRGTQARLQIGGGTVDTPAITGTAERFALGGVEGQLTVGNRQFLLELDPKNDSMSVVPHFAPARDDAEQRLPLVQQGKLFIAAEHLDRGQFDRIVAGLYAVRPADFIAHAQGQTTTELQYLWPTRLPEDYTIDLSTIRYGQDDFVLQGGFPYFEIAAKGPEGSTVIIKGGRNESGAGFVVPEGPDVEQIMTTVHGRGATAARTADGAVIVWTESGSTYEISSRTVELDQLLAIAQSMTQVDTTVWNRYLANGPDTAPGITQPIPLVNPDLASTNAEISAAETSGEVSGEAAVTNVSTEASDKQVAMTFSEPDRLLIPEIGLDTPLFAVNTLVPKHDVGWYQHSGRPGEGTNMIFWGHVMRWKDAPEVPAPFADVHLLKLGDRISVVAADGKQHDYAVTRQIRVTPDQVNYLAPTPHEQLMLISCIGEKIIVNGELTKAERLLTIAEPVE